VIIGLTMHLGIMLFMVVGPFSPISMSLYFALYTPAEYKRLARFFGARFKKAPA